MSDVKGSHGPELPGPQLGLTSNDYENQVANTIKTEETVCPSCHYCPTCGRGSHYPNYVPYYPSYPNTPFYPQYQVWC